METLNKLAEEDLSMLEKATKSLDQEEKEDEALRQKYSNQWTRYS
jgi:hypothetical protein